MAQSQTKITAPRPTDVTLTDLDTITANAVQPDTLLDYCSLVGADLSGRDLYDVRVQDCEWTEVDLSEANLVRARIRDTRFQSITATSLKAAKAEVRNTEILSSRIGVLDLGSAQLRSVLFKGCKLGYVNLRGARLVDVRFEDCMIDELDLADAAIERMAFTTSHAAAISINVESARDLDLRTLGVERLQNIRSLSGMIIDEPQLQQFAETFARQLGAHID